MTALLVSPTTPTGATASVTTRVSDLITDLEKQIKAYIHEQQACDPLHLVDSGTSTSSHQRLPRTRYTETKRSPRPEREKISLDLIFDTPECRTESSPVLPGGCQLLRRGATFHRVDRATAEASDLRSRQWERLVDSSAEHRHLLEGSGVPPTFDALENATKSALAAISTKTLPMKTEDRGGSENAMTHACIPAIASAGGSIEGSEEAIDRPAPLRARSHSPNCIDLNHSMKSSSRPPSPDLELEAHGGLRHLRQRPITHDPSRLPPSPPRTISPTFEASVSEAFAPASPTCFEDALQLDVGLSKHAFQIRKVLAADEARTQTRTVSEDKGQAKTKSGRAVASSTRSKSVSRKGRRRGTVRSVNSRKKGQPVKAVPTKNWRVGQSVTGLLSGRMFHRLEADEMIDTSKIQHHVVAESPTAMDPPSSVAQSDEERIQHPSPGVGQDDSEVHPAFRRSQDSTCPAVSISTSSERDEDIVKPSPVSQVSSTSTLSLKGQRASTTLPIPVLKTPESEDQEEDEDLWFRSCRLSTRSVSIESMNRRNASAAENLDWTAFQMAISGPTGSYLMGGADEHPEVAIDDDAETLSWFESYGFDSEGRLVRSYVEEDGLGEAMHSPEDDWMYLAPVELPGLDSQISSVRSSSGLTMGTEHGGVEGGPSDQPCNMMSANLTDLGDYLNFELSHVGVIDAERFKCYD
ncbi:MAG: hypothetical protein M1817_002514 [Caeruleum heppii]|nr:MAG: hypothetical protein M1817_002514 [Caeruleum heppii]